MISQSNVKLDGSSQLERHGYCEKKYTERGKKNTDQIIEI